MMPTTRATISSGRWRLNAVTAVVQPVSISTHSSMDPSWEPQVAANLYCTGSRELEFCTTFATEKSLFTKDQARQPKAMATNTNCPWAAGFARETKAGMPLCAPTRGSVPCTRASISAQTRANCPISGTMFSLRYLTTRDFWAFWACSTAWAASGGM
jgi:hypothetical protein